MIFIERTPLWVWPLLIVLVALGWHASRTRETPTLIIYLLPLMGFIGLNTLLNLAHPLIAFSAFAVGYGLGGLAGHGLQARWLIAKQTGKVHLHGEWLTMGAMMCLFFAGFINGTIAAIAPETGRNILYLAVLSGGIGLCSGSFMGRAIRVFRFPITQ